MAKIETKQEQLKLVARQRTAPLATNQLAEVAANKHCLRPKPQAPAASGCSHQQGQNIKTRANNKNCNNKFNSTKAPVSVVNLSSRTITLAQQFLFQKGLNFCPSPGNHHSTEARSDLHLFHKNFGFFQLCKII